MSLEMNNRALVFQKTSALLLISSDMHQSVFAVSLESFNTFNSMVPPTHAISEDLLLNFSLRQKDLSSRLEEHQFEQLLFQSPPANHARLLSVPSCHAASWIAVIPSVTFTLSLVSS